MKENIKKYNFKESTSSEFEILDLAKLYQHNYNEITKPNRLGCYQILWFKKGTTKHWVDFKELNILPNNILFLDKKSVQKFDKKGYPRGKLILFTDDFFSKTSDDILYLKKSILFNDLLTTPKFIVKEDSLHLQKILNQITQELGELKDDVQIDILRNLLRNFLLYSEREHRKGDFIKIKQDNNLSYVLNFKELLENNFIKHKNVSFYCQKMQISAKKLNAATSMVLRNSPKNIIIERVLLEAKRMLVNTFKNTKDISYNLGFEEPTNFVKFFKKQLFKTPLEFRESFKKE